MEIIEIDSFNELKRRLNVLSYIYYDSCFEVKHDHPKEFLAICFDKTENVLMHFHNVYGQNGPPYWWQMLYNEYKLVQYCLQQNPIFTDNYFIVMDECLLNLFLLKHDNLNFKICKIKSK